MLALALVLSSCHRGLGRWELLRLSPLCAFSDYIIALLFACTHHPRSARAHDRTHARQVGGMKRGRAALGKNAVFAVYEGASAGDHEFGSVAELAAASSFS